MRGFGSTCSRRASLSSPWALVPSEKRTTGVRRNFAARRAIALTNVLAGQPWDASAEAFPLMCPLTQTNCHSLCACFKEYRTTTSYRGTDEDVAFRCDGHAYGRCEFFKFEIGTYVNTA